MILAHHSIFTMYGFWLPNDPRGSGSDYIAVWDLYRFGPATKTNSRASVAGVPHDHELRLAAKRELKHPPVNVSGVQAAKIGEGICQASREGKYSIHACAIMPDHVHLVIGAHPRAIRQLVGHLKSRATHVLKESGKWANADRPLWGEHSWNIRLEDSNAVERAIRYVEQNPIKEGKKAQRWTFVTPFDEERARLVATIPRESQRKIGGAALNTLEQARRKRRG